MPEAPDAPRKMPRVIWHLGWISFFADVSSEMAYPIVPLFVSQVLRAPVAALGAIEGVAQAVVSIMKGWSGVQSDRIGRRLPFVQWGYGLSAIGKPLLAFTSVWPAVLGARSLDRLGKGLRTTARDALIADAADPRDYGKAFGLHSGLDTAGAFVGVMLLALLVWRGLASADFRNLFLWAGVPGLVSWFLTLLLREPRARDASEAKPPEAGKAAKRFD
ncbi:MAG: MFS transporter, partial [Fimbriimonas ginsengisoli]|nr:MFS transporter [Fimbriimonas ginsengisoli]